MIVEVLHSWTLCHRIMSNFMQLPNLLRRRFTSTYGFYHHARELDEELLLPEWNRIAYAQLFKLTHLLKNVEYIDGRLSTYHDASIITNDHIISHMQTFNSLARAFIRSASITYDQRKVFSNQSQMKSLTLDSLTKVCNFLNVSAQQRKSVRLKLCPQVTQHHIWRGAVEEVLRDLKREMDYLECHSPAVQMGGQILSSCMKFFAETTNLSNTESPSWMRPPPLRNVENPLPSHKWEEVLEMFVHLSKCLGQEQKLAGHVLKLEAMKEGLYQIRDILIERDISYKEAKQQDCLVQKKLSKSLGHSSKCLFTLLLYYLYGTVKNLEVEVSGGLHGSGGKFYLCIGKILTACDEGMILNGVKQLSRALGVFKFVWDMSGMIGQLELQGHVWCLGAEESTLTYRGNVFHVHGIKL